MENARFYVDFCYEAGSDEYGANVSGRYQFAIDLTDEEYEELYQMWYNQNELNSWSTIWDGHDNLNRNPLDILWELSQETKSAF